MLTKKEVDTIARRPIKNEIRTLIAKAIDRNFRTRLKKKRGGYEITMTRSGRGGLRWFTLPGPSWVSEQVFLESLPQVAEKVEQVVGAEHSDDPGLLRTFKSTARSLRQRWPKIDFRPIVGSDKTILTPGVDRNRRHDLLPAKGFDFVWLDYCCPWTESTRCSLALMAENISVFERAWAQGRPGLLYITLQMGADSRSALNTLDWIVSGMSLSGSSVDPKESYQRRACGITELLNRHTKPNGWTCIPTQWVFYRETLTESLGARMYLLGFEVWKGNFDIETEYERVREVRFNT